MSPSRKPRGTADVNRAVHRWAAAHWRAWARLSSAEQAARAAKTLAAARARLARSEPEERSRVRGKSRRSLELIDAARAILEQIQPASVRAVGYQAFTRGVLTSMSKGEMNRLSAQLTYAREAGLIPWASIVDETREPERVSAWEDPAAYIETVQRAYRRDRWSQQAIRLEVWSEKGTVRGTLRPVLDRFGVTFRVMHGYASATSLYDAAQDSQRSDKPLVVFYVGDWDPSGLHMSEIDLPRRLEQYGGQLTLVRLALTDADTHAGLPSFATETKRRDARFQWYARRYGSRCWELDALSPVVLRQSVERAIVDRLDVEAWQRAEVAERAECESLASILQSWPGIAASKSGHALKSSDAGGRS